MGDSSFPHLQRYYLYLGDRWFVVEYPVVLERNPDTGVWVAEVPGISGCYSQGATREEALANVREALQLVLETDGPPRQYTVEFDKVRIEA